MNNKKLIIGLFGFGVVGEGLYKALQQTPTLQASIKKICIKDPGKKRAAPSSLFTTDRDELLFDPEINVIVEVINESDAAYYIVSTALTNGKAVVSASKKMISEYLNQLLELQRKVDLPFLYEAAACASIPVIRNLEEYYDNDLLHGIRAIVNGSTNYILTRMFEDKLTFPEALLSAQTLGFAEKDPTLDVNGWDATHKWCILLTHAYGIITSTGQLLFNGIQNVSAQDAKVAAEKGLGIKLVAQARKLKSGKIAACVLPQFVHSSDTFHFVKNEFNGVEIESHFADRQFFYGKGAGSFPTASAVLSDIAALRYDYKYEYKKLHQAPAELTDEYYLKVYVRFQSWKDIPKQRFESIDEVHEDKKSKYLTGLIHYKELKNSNWWKENHTSLILLPDAIEESVEIRKIKKRSLELGGVISL
jgi:homoserine dehydrogenase